MASTSAARGQDSDMDGEADQRQPATMIQIQPSPRVLSSCVALPTHALNLRGQHNMVRSFKRASELVIDHAASYGGGSLHDLLSLGIVFVMVDCTGFASEFVPCLVTSVFEVDPHRSPTALPSSNIVRGGGILLKELVSARANDNPSRLAAITFTFDGSIYLVCDSPEDFVWLPSDGFERTRAPHPRMLAAEEQDWLMDHGYQNAAEYYQDNFRRAECQEEGDTKCDCCGGEDMTGP